MCLQHLIVLHYEYPESDRRIVPLGSGGAISDLGLFLYDGDINWSALEKNYDLLASCNYWLFQLSISLKIDVIPENKMIGAS